MSEGTYPTPTAAGLTNDSLTSSHSNTTPASGLESDAQAHSEGTATSAVPSTPSRGVAGGSSGLAGLHLNHGNTNVAGSSLDGLPFTPGPHFPGSGQHGVPGHWSSFHGGLGPQGLGQMSSFAYPQQHMMAMHGGGGGVSGMWQADPFAFGGLGGQRNDSFNSTGPVTHAPSMQSEASWSSAATAPGTRAGDDPAPMLSQPDIDNLVTERINLEIKDIQANIHKMVDAGVKAGMDTHLKELVDAELARIFRGNKKSQGGNMPPAILIGVLQRAVHSDMRFLMGLRDKTGRSGRKKTWVLPDPLGPGEEGRKAGDGSPLHNPDWYKDVSAEVNEYLISSTVTLVKQNTDHHQLDPVLAQSDDLIRRAAVGYYKSMKRKYIGDHNPEAAEKMLKRELDSKEYQRRHRKTDRIRIGIEPLRIVFGTDETEGVGEVVGSPYVSEEVSADEANRLSEVRDAYRREADVGLEAFEVRPPMWRAVEITRLYIVLTVFARYVREKEDVGDLQDALAALATEAAESDMPEEERLSKSTLLRRGYLAKVEAAVKGWSTIYFNRSQRHERFRGPRAHYNYSAPNVSAGSHTLYAESISDKWAALNDENSRLQAKLPARPSTFTIFDLELPDSLIPADDLAWLATMEDVGYEGGGEEDAET